MSIRYVRSDCQGGLIQKKKQKKHNIVTTHLIMSILVFSGTLRGAIKGSFRPCGVGSVEGVCFPRVSSGPIRLLSVEFEDQINSSDSLLCSLSTSLEKMMKGPLLTCWGRQFLLERDVNVLIVTHVEGVIGEYCLFMLPVSGHNVILDQCLLWQMVNDLNL